jgi:hypothetical protein
MVPVKNPLEVYASLPKTNCGDCPARTCLAFASALVRGESGPAGCPHLAAPEAAAITAYLDGTLPAHHEQEAELRRLRAGVAALDQAAAAERLGATVAGGRLTVKSLGKDFAIDASGGIASDCHTHPGLAIPLLRYVLFSRGGRPSGNWLPFRELAGAAGRERHFEQMCEKPLRRLVDAHTELLKDLIDLFSGERSINLFGSDLSLVLYPLPRIPLLVCYWGPEEGMESSLHLFFDATATDHLSAEWIHGLCAGLVAMFEKIALRHAGEAPWGGRER